MCDLTLDKLLQILWGAIPEASPECLRCVPLSLLMTLQEVDFPWLKDTRKGTPKESGQSLR